MLMERRGNIIKKFSSFISFTGDNHQIKLNWQVDLTLENSIKLKVAADPEAKESFWVQYFLKVLLVQHQLENPECIPTAKRHFSAYLQEACFKAAKDIHHELKYIQHKYSLEECFQIANIAANSPSKFFKNFNLERSKINVEAYAITTFKRFIRNQIYQQDLEARRTRFSNYGLLKNLSVKELNEALLAQNFNNQQIILYRLGWQCFNEIFQPSYKQLSRTANPSEEDFTVIANYYNQRCKQLNLINVSATDITIKEILETCINAAKNYRTKQYFSFEENYHGICDDTASTLDILIQQEEWQQVQVIIDNLFTNMPKLCQIIFQLWQGLNLTQTEIANLLKFKYPELQKQYQVARQLKRYTRSILREFAEEWNKVNSEIYLDNDKDIERIKSALDKCLGLYCKQFLFSILDKIFQNFIVEKQKNCDLSHPLNLVMVIKLNLIDLFQNELEKSMYLETNSLSAVNHKLVDIVNEWIEIKQENYDDRK
ncbi:MAG: sigma-70 family RNA polymerase sigma factor [Richelia sp. RM2_1_2]|nr:sigma-70 family RNA polymerase sigma factor [Richelia sp. SM1_7_0]NJN07125.1 sigma-70 family RNA polymerase sigma factor [Richelia sp. RM1_1_1]NJO58856.1 sigma-70 family RNA polymerase sigma factor [Richelia sp. RM2_1_2]